jgi:hypothetical protein
MGELFPEATRLGIELVILDGGANDLDFQSYLNPEDHRDDYIRFYEPRFEEYFHQRTKRLITRARGLFPNAVIVYTGLYTPFLPNVSNGSVKELFEDESGKPGWQIWLNNNIIEIKNVDQLVLEAQYRSLHGLTRGLYWMRRTIAEINDDPKLRGPGVIFIHPQFRTENTVFEKNTFIHKEYKVGELTDAVRNVRDTFCPRNEFRDEMSALLLTFIFQSLNELRTVPPPPVTLSDSQKRMIEDLIKKLDGPTSMLGAFQELLDRPTREIRDKAVTLLYGDLSRIHNALRASFLHPNEKGALRYTNVIVKRYKERIHQIHFRDDLLKLQSSTSPAQIMRMKDSMRRFGFREPLSLRTITQNMLVDSIRLDIKTGPESVKDFIDELILDMGGENRWTLTMPGRIFIVGGGPTFDPIQPQLKPNTSDSFTIDASGLHLGSLKQFKLERRIHPFLATGAGKQFGKFGSGDLRPTQITLQINGKTVFDVPFFGSLSRGDTLTFPYPK